MQTLDRRCGGSSLGGYLAYRSQNEMIERILSSANTCSWAFWEVWAFMPEQNIFYIFQQNHYQKCKFTDNRAYLKEDPHFTIMTRPLTSRIIPWSTLPPQYAPKGLNGLSLFLHHNSGYLGFAKLGIVGPVGDTQFMGDDLFLEMITHYKKALEQELVALRSSYYQKEVNS